MQHFTIQMLPLFNVHDPSNINATFHHPNVAFIQGPSGVNATFGWWNIAFIFDGPWIKATFGWWNVAFIFDGPWIKATFGWWNVAFIFDGPWIEAAVIAGTHGCGGWHWGTPGWGSHEAAGPVPASAKVVTSWKLCRSPAAMGSYFYRMTQDEIQIKLKQQNIGKIEKLSCTWTFPALPS